MSDGSDATMDDETLLVAQEDDLQETEEAKEEALMANTVCAQDLCTNVQEVDGTAPAEPYREAVPLSPRSILLRQIAAHTAPMTVLGIVSQSPFSAVSPHDVLEQLFLQSMPGDDVKQIVGLDLAGLSCIFLEQENVLVLSMSSSPSPWVSNDEDDLQDSHAFHSGGLGELENLSGLMLLFNLCHSILWLCPGSAPRVDAAALRSLTKVQQLQEDPTVAGRLDTGHAGSPGSAMLLFVHTELKIPFSCGGHEVIDSIEKALDSRWRSCLKRLKLLQDNKRNGILRLLRPCAVALGPLAPSGAAGALGHARAEAGSIAAAVEAEPSPFIDRFRSRIAELLASARRAATGPSRWLSTAQELGSSLLPFLSTAGQLPEDLAAAVLRTDSEVVPRAEVPKHLNWSLSSWAHSELFFSFSTAQDAVEQACRAFAVNLKSSDLQEQQLRAEQLVQQKAYGPFRDFALSETRRHCERLSAPKRQSHEHLKEEQRSFRPSRPCLCGKSQVQVADAVEAPKAPIMAIPPFGPCCHNASFMPFLPISFTDTELEPVLIPPAPCLGKIKPGGIVMTALPSALPEAQGFVALVADAPINIDPSEGARLPGFGDQLTQLSCWRIPVVTPSAPRRAVCVGFEYFCPQGHRFMAPPPKCSGLVVADPELSRPRRSRRRKDGYREGQPPATPAVMDESGAGELEVAPLCPYRLFLPCVRHRDRRPRSKGRENMTSCIAQLGRIWVFTPPGSCGSLTAAPRVCVVDPAGPAGVDGRAAEVVVTGGKVALPPNTLVQLVLPSTYFRPGDVKSPLPRCSDLSAAEAERCRLLPYLLSLRRPT